MCAAFADDGDWKAPFEKIVFERNKIYKFKTFAVQDLLQGSTVFKSV